MTWYDPQGWIDLLDHAWYGLVLIAVAGVPAWIAARNHRGIKAIKDQVVNDHEGKPALRADIDMIREDISSLRDEVRGGFSAARAADEEERNARRDGDSAIRDEIKRHHPD